MAGLSNTHELALLEWLFKRTAFPSVPTALHYSLHSADPGDTGASELASTAGYVRAQLDADTNNSTNTNYNAAGTSGTTQVISNKLDITFPTATGNWNSSSAIGYWGVWSASTSGTYYASGTITGGVVVLNTNTLKFAGGTPGSLTFDVD